jgi:hypothetical protein
MRALRMQLEAGIAELERGDFIEIDEADLGSYLENDNRQVKRAP